MKPLSARCRVVFPLLLLAGCESRGGDELIGPATETVHRVAFLDDRESNEQFRVYVARFDGHTYDVSGALVAGGDVLDYAWSPDERRVAFLADAFFDGITQLFVADSANGARVEIATDLVPFGQVGSFAWAPDGSRIAFVAESQALGAFDLSTCRPDGTGVVRVSTAFLPGQFVSRVKWSPDGTRIAYAANQQTGMQELFVAPADGSAPSVRVSGAMVANGGLAPGLAAFEWAPNGSRIAYMAEQDVDNLVELYTSTPDGVTNVQVSGPSSSSVDMFTWAPNGTRIAYSGQLQTPGRVELFTVQPDGTGDVRVSGDLAPGGNVELWEWSPLSNRLAYRAGANSAITQQLFTVAPTGGTIVTLTPQVFDVGVGQFAWAPDGSRIAYLARQDTVLFMELYTIRPDASENVKASAEFKIAGAVVSFLWNPTAQSIAYAADLDVQGVNEVHVAGPFGGGGRLTGPSATGASVEQYRWTADGATLVYQAQQETGGVSELYAVAASGGDGIKLSGPQNFGGNVVDFQIPGVD